MNSLLTFFLEHIGGNGDFVSICQSWELDELDLNTAIDIKSIIRSIYGLLWELPYFYTDTYPL
jgi:hypothetical protein